jgi:hypothetical protein
MKNPRIIDFLVETAVSFIVAVGLFCLVFFWKQDFSYNGWSNAFVVPGTVLLMVAGLAFVTRAGGFDILTYSFMQIGSTFRREPKPSFHSLYDYSEYKKEKRKAKPYAFWPAIGIGTICFVLAGLFAIIALQVQ